MFSTLSLAETKIPSNNGNSYIAVRVTEKAKLFYSCQAGSPCLLLGGRSFTDSELQEFIHNEKVALWKARGVRTGVTIAGVVLGAVIDSAIVIAAASTSGGALIYFPIIGSVAGGMLSWKYSPEVISMVDTKTHSDRIDTVKMVNGSKVKALSENELFMTAKILQESLEKISGQESKQLHNESRTQFELP